MKITYVIIILKIIQTKIGYYMSDLDYLYTLINLIDDGDLSWGNATIQYRADHDQLKEYYEI